MNNDLISRETLKKKIQGVVENEMPIDKKWALGLRYALKLIDNAPKVELQMGRMTNGVIIPIARPKGEWIFDTEFTEFGNPYGCYRCDKCGGHSSDKYPFCFWCGADMRKEADNEM